MKALLFTFLMFILCQIVSSQNKMTDREFEGFKGKVKSVLNEFVDKAGSKRKIGSQYFFDEDGRLSKVLYPDNNYQVIFTQIDGFKTFKGMKIETETIEKPILATTVGFEEPIEGPDKIVPPDERFDEKYKYEYDLQGRVKTEREFLNNGKLVTLTTFVYDENGNLIEKTVNTTSSIDKFINKYDAKGNLIEQIENTKIKSNGKDYTKRTVFSDYKLDTKSNWIQRKRVYISETDGRSRQFETIEFRTVVYY